MVSYRVDWKNSAVRELRAMDKQHIRRIVSSVESLAENPFPHNSRRLVGLEESFRLRVGDYRVIYQVDPSKKSVTVCRVKHRKEAYR